MAKEEHEKKKDSFKKRMKKKRFGLWTLILACLGAVIISGGTVFLIMGRQVQSLQATNESMGKINTIYNVLYNNYYKEVNRQKLVDGAITGMVNALGDPFTEYMDESESQSLNDSISGSFGGIGAQVQKSGNELKIIAPIADTPADKAGLKANDVIVKIDGKETKDLTLNKAVSTMRGKVGTKVKLTIKRGDTTFEKTLTRAKIPVTTVEGK